MNRIRSSFVRVFFRNLRRFNEEMYLGKSFLLKSRNICLTTSNLAYFSGRATLYDTSLTSRRKLCDTSTVTCWKCNYSYFASLDGEAVFFCPFCNVVQEPFSERTYFDIMNCKQTFDVDTKQLTQQFRYLQSQLHPDKFSLKSETEQNLSSVQSSLVNEAYQTLLKPLARGLYLLELEGLAMEEGNVVNDVDFLAEIMDMNETVQNGSDETLTKIRIQVEENLEFYNKKASNAFDEGDFVAAKDILSKMRYYNNISEQLREKSWDEI